MSGEARDAIEAALQAMAWTDPRMISAAHDIARGRLFNTYGRGDDCFLTSFQVQAFRYCLAGAAAAIRNLPTPPVEPDEPTEEMIEAGDAVVDTWPYGHTISTSELIDAYKAMRAARPASGREGGEQ